MTALRLETGGISSPGCVTSIDLLGSYIDIKSQVDTGVMNTIFLRLRSI